MKKLLFTLALIITAMSTWSQTRSDHELADPKPVAKETWQNINNISFAWGSIDVRYSRSAVPQLPKIKQPMIYGWKGERLSLQAVLTTPVAIKSFRIKVSDLKSGKKKIAAENINKYFVRYTMSDSDINRKDSILVADRLSPIKEMKLEAQTVRPIWLDIHIPQNAESGTYKGTLIAQCDDKEFSLPFTVEVSKRTLPSPNEWKYHLDLWQNPFAVARYYNVPLWSKAHFDYMRPIMKQLANAGGKVITCSIIQHPWNSQTEDPFESMITKMKTVDGEWRYDYTVFDRWVEFMMECGITKQIDCYTLVPWHYRFDYFDMASNTVKYFDCKPGDKQYEDFLLPFLRDFATHLKKKGWFSRTCIAMDERPMKQLQAAYELVRKADPDYRIEGAFNYFPDIVSTVYDVSIAYQYDLLDEKILEERRKNGHPVTFYTCCAPTRPNTFTFSPPAESAYMGWHAVAAGYDGYLRWAYNSWVKAPCQDSRFRTWASGDCFLVYPGESSIRWERLVQGIQDFEKVHILLNELTGKKKQKLQEIVARFRPNDYTEEDDAAKMIREAEKELRALE